MQRKELSPAANPKEGPCIGSHKGHIGGQYRLEITLDLGALDLAARWDIIIWDSVQQKYPSG